MLFVLSRVPTMNRTPDLKPTLFSKAMCLEKCFLNGRIFWPIYVQFRSDEGLTFETSAKKLSTVANL